MYISRKNFIFWVHKMSKVILNLPLKLTDFNIQISSILYFHLMRHWMLGHGVPLPWIWINHPYFFNSIYKKVSLWQTFVEYSHNIAFMNISVLTSRVIHFLFSYNLPFISHESFSATILVIILYFEWIWNIGCNFVILWVFFGWTSMTASI